MIKKGLIIAGRSLLGLLLMISFMGVGLFVISQALGHSMVLDLVDVAFVIPENDSELKLAARYASTIDSVKSIASVSYASEEEALDGVREGRYGAAVVFPPGFVEDAIYGKNTPCVIYFPSQMNDSLSLFYGLLRDAVSMLRTGEACAYAVLQTADEYKTDIRPEAGHIGDHVAQMYGEVMLGRNRIFITSVMSAYGDVNIWEYYISSLIIMVIIFFGTNFSAFYKKEDRALEDKLYIYGIDRRGTFAIRSIVMGIIIGLIMLLLQLLLRLGMRWIGASGQQPPVGIGNVGVIQTISYSLIICLTVAVYVNIIYTITSDTAYGSTLLMVCNMIMLIISGVIIPTGLLPGVFGQLKSYMPLYWWHRMVGFVLFGG